MMETRKEVQVDGHRIVYSIHGDGPAIVLLHPIGLDRTWWSPFVDALGSRYRLIAIDQLGHGDSAPILGEIELQDLAHDVHAIVAAEQLTDVHLLGVSMGGMVAQHAAVSNPAWLRSLVLCSTAATFSDSTRETLRQRGEAALRDGMQASVLPTLQRWFSPEGQSGQLARRCADRLLADDPENWAACWRAISRLHTRPLLDRLRTPTLVAVGAADAATPPAAAEVIADAVAGAKLVVVPSAHHLGTYENPGPFLHAFANFLERHST